jgi:hypothetical protein
MSPQYTEALASSSDARSRFADLEAIVRAQSRLPAVTTLLDRYEQMGRRCVLLAATRGEMEEWATGLEGRGVATEIGGGGR